MKKTLQLLLLVFLSLQVFSQIPQGFKYQAVLRDNSGAIMSLQGINLSISIIDSSNAVTVFSEIHKTTTNKFGLFSVEVGRGINQTGSFDSIPWQNGNIWIEINSSDLNGNNFIETHSELLSVPYALYADRAANVDDADADSTNEIQIITLVGNQIILSSGGSITLPTIAGPQGADGATGATGPQGSQGPTGAQGIAGADGTTGVQGIQGLVGATGAQGVQGPIGSIGPQGANGANGTDGIDGVDGNTGPQGSTGLTGQAGTNATLPSGIILMWSGSINNIPAGFALCDGANGTPNLLDRFIVSIPNASTNPGATGGANTYVLTSAQLPVHNHTGSGTTNTAGNHAHTGNTSIGGNHTHTLPGYHLSQNPSGNIPWYNWSNNSNQAYNTSTTSTSGNHSHSITTNSTGNHGHPFNFTTDNSGNGASIDNRPAYYTLAFIIKL